MVPIGQCGMGHYSSGFFVVLSSCSKTKAHNSYVDFLYFFHCLALVNLNVPFAWNILHFLFVIFTLLRAAQVFSYFLRNSFIQEENCFLFFLHILIYCTLLQQLSHWFLLFMYFMSFFDYQNPNTLFLALIIVLQRSLVNITSTITWISWRNKKKAIVYVMFYLYPHFSSGIKLFARRWWKCPHHLLSISFPTRAAVCFYGQSPVPALINAAWRLRCLFTNPLLVWGLSARQGGMKIQILSIWLLSILILV